MVFEPRKVARELNDMPMYARMEFISNVLDVELAFDEKSGMYGFRVEDPEYKDTNYFYTLIEGTNPRSSWIDIAHNIWAYYDYFYDCAEVTKMCERINEHLPFGFSLTFGCSYFLPEEDQPRFPYYVAFSRPDGEVYCFFNAKDYDDGDISELLLDVIDALDQFATDWSVL